jgi:RNA polymerase sigma-70 factor (ECF subfamily)
MSGRSGCGSTGEDWEEIQRRLLAGDRLAFLTINRLITGLLAQLRAYDFREEWDDLRQEVVMSIVANARAGRLREPKAFVGYVRIITRNKLVDRLKERLRRKEKEVLAWDEASAEAVAAPPPEGDPAVWAAVRDLPEQEALVVEQVYRYGKTYQEVSDDTGIPLGTMKRRLRDGLRALRDRLGSAEEGP